MRAAAALALLALLRAPARAADPADAFQQLLQDHSTEVAAEFSIEVPHPELRVKAGGFQLTPALGLESVFTFRPSKAGVDVRGELCLLETEAAEMQGVAVEQGFQILAVHDHFIGEAPKLLYVHLSGHGSRDEMTDRARRVLDALRKSRTARGLQPGPTIVENGLDRPKLERALGAQAKEREGVVVVPLSGVDFAAFSGGADKALMIGRVDPTYSENPDLAADLVKSGLALAAAATGELRFFAVGKPGELAAALHSAVQKKAPGP